MAAVAFALSTIVPVGVARPVEPTRGHAFDAWAILPGALAMAVAAAVVVIVALCSSTSLDEFVTSPRRKGGISTQ
jgi:hypothetical protein